MPLFEKFDFTIGISACFLAISGHLSQIFEKIDLIKRQAYSCPWAERAPVPSERPPLVAWLVMCGIIGRASCDGHNRKRDSGRGRLDRASAAQGLVEDLTRTHAADILDPIVWLDVVRALARWQGDQHVDSPRNAR